MNLSYKIIILKIIFFSFACKSTKTIPEMIKHNDNATSKIENQVKQSNDSISCNGIIYKIDFCQEINNSELLQCITSSIFIGDKNAIENYCKLLEGLTSCASYTDGVVTDEEWMNYQSIYFLKPRGNRAFECLLTFSNQFQCYDDYTLNEGSGPHTRPIHFLFFQSYTSMIRSIDGMSVEEYLLKVNPNTSEKLEQHFKDKCQEIEYRNNYNAIKSAYEKGLVKLKDYGED